MSTSTSTGTLASAPRTGSYATLDQLREYLPTTPRTTEADTLLQRVLDRATSLIDLALGFSFEGFAESSRRVGAGYGPFLSLPPHQVGSVTEVAPSKDPATPVDPDLWDEMADGTLWRDPATNPNPWGADRYLVTASWGYGDPPEAVAEVCLELAVNIYRSRDAGRFSDVVGVAGGGAVGYERALTAQQKLILERVRAHYHGVVFE
jgi:hypothetical protein